MSKKRERQVCARVRGFECTLLDMCHLSNTQLVRYALRKYYEEHPMDSQAEVEAEISFLQDKITECELLIESYEASIQEKIQELSVVHKRIDYKNTRLVMKMYDLYISFLEDDKYEEYDSLEDFYTLYRDKISILGMRFSKTYPETIDLFEKYLENFVDAMSDDFLIDDEVSD